MYYYLLSSLPYLTESTDDIPSIDEFLTLCEEQASAKHLAVIKAARINKYEQISDTHSFLAEYARLEMSLRNEIAWERSRKTHLSFEPYDADSASWYRERVVQAVNAPSPLTAENMLLTVRFELLSQLESGRYFTLENVIAYFIRLQLLHRKKQMNRTNGEESLGSAYQTIQAPLEKESGLSVGV